MARQSKWVLAIGAALLLALSPLSTPRAQEEGSGLGYSEQVDLTEFVPATDTGEQVSAPLMVTLAYGFIWALAMGFLYTIWRRGRKLTAEMEVARQRLAELDARLAERLHEGDGP